MTAAGRNLREDGFLETGDGHRVFWRAAGAAGRPAFLVIHGGPGAGSTPTTLSLFDLATTYVVQIDQRGAGRSTPAGEVAHNTPVTLLQDIEAVRTCLGIAKWTVLAGSWGTTLAILYAGRHGDRCQGLILRGVTEWSRDKYDWALRHRRFLAPEAHAYLMGILTEEEREDVLAAYHRRIFADDEEAARRWYLYEAHFVETVPAQTIGDTTNLPRDYRERARLHVHYWINGAFLTAGWMDHAIDAIRDLPVWIVQGSLDLVCPPLYAHNLSSRLSRCSLRMVPGGGHSQQDPLIAAALKEAVQEARSSV